MPLIPTFSKMVDLDRVPADVVTHIVHDLNEVALTLDSLPRDSAIWRSMMRGQLRMLVCGRTVEYVVEPEQHRIVVVSVSA